ncbi:hypothetical protein Tco_0961420 [Tanacetum coccineum]
MFWAARALHLMLGLKRLHGFLEVTVAQVKGHHVSEHGLFQGCHGQAVHVYVANFNGEHGLYFAKACEVSEHELVANVDNEQNVIKCQSKAASFYSRIRGGSAIKRLPK